MPENKEMYIKSISFPVLHYAKIQEEIKDKEITYSIAHRFIKVDDNMGETSLRFQITRDQGLGYEMDIVVSGVFEVENYEQTQEGRYLMRNTAITILYPYLRDTVQRLHSLAEVKPVILPVVDTISVFGDQSDSLK